MTELQRLRNLEVPTGNIDCVVNIKYRHTFSFPFAPHAAICSAEDFLSISL